MSSKIYWSALILSFYAVLYRFRHLDRNVFFSWSEIFEHVFLAEIVLLLSLCILLSHALSRIRMKLDERLTPFMLFFVTFLIGAIFWSTPEINPDMGRYFTEARYVEEYGATSFIRNWGSSTNALGDYLVLADLPAVPLLYGLIFKIFGKSWIYMRIFGTALFASTVVITYLIGRKLWGKTGIYSGALLLSSPYLLLKSSLTLVEIPMMFFTAAAIYSTLNALEKGRSRIWALAAAVFIFFAFFSKLSAWPALGAIPAVFLISYLKGKDMVVLRRGGLIALLSGALIFAFIFYKFDIFLDLPLQISSLVDLQMNQYRESPLSLLFFQISPVITILSISSFYFAFKKRDLNYVLLLFWFLVPLLVFHSSRLRYMVSALPALAIMASIGLSEIGTENNRKFVVYSTVLCSLALAAFYYLPYTHSYSTTNLKNAAEYTDTLDVDGVEFFAVFPENYRFNLNILLPVFDIYSNKEVKTPLYWESHTKPPPAGWTWRYIYPPPFYSQEPSFKNAIVTVSPKISEAMPDDLENRLTEYKLARIYSAGDTSSIYPYIVKVYLPNPHINVTSPKNGMTLKAGASFNITWDVVSLTNTRPTFLVNAYSPSTDTYQMMDGTKKRWYVWDVEKEAFPPADDYRIRIQASDDDWQTYYFADSEIFSID